MPWVRRAYLRVPLQSVVDSVICSNVPSYLEGQLRTGVLLLKLLQDKSVPSWELTVPRTVTFPSEVRSQHVEE